VYIFAEIEMSHSYYLVILNLLRNYERKDRKYRESVFPLALAMVLKAMEMNDLAEKVEADPHIAYAVAKKLAEDYFTMKNDVVISTIMLRHLAEELAKSVKPSSEPSS